MNSQSLICLLAAFDSFKSEFFLGLSFSLGLCHIHSLFSYFSIFYTSPSAFLQCPNIRNTHMFQGSEFFSNSVTSLERIFSHLITSVYIICDTCLWCPGPWSFRSALISDFPVVDSSMKAQTYFTLQWSYVSHALSMFLFSPPDHQKYI